MTTPRGLPIAVAVLLVAAAEPTDPAAGRGLVVAEHLEVYDAPDGRGYPIADLVRGTVVAVQQAEPGGWLAIEPPSGVFCWIEEAAIEVRSGAGAARVAADRAAVRVGREGARLPGPPRIELGQGAAVRLLDHPPLRLRQGRTTRSWRAIAPPPGLLFYVAADGVRLDPGTAVPRRPVARPAPEAFPIAASLASIGPPIPTDRLPPDVAAAVRRVEAEHRGMLRLPLERWQLEAVRARYKALLDSVPDPTTRDLVQVRLDQVARQAAAATAARRLSDLLTRGPRIEPPDALEAGPGDGEPGRRGRAVPYDARGFLQPSTALIDGQKTYLLIGSDGFPAAYLRVPPGMPAEPLLSRTVGVRGTVRYNESLRTRVIDATDLDPLDASP